MLNRFTVALSTAVVCGLVASLPSSAQVRVGVDNTVRTTNGVEWSKSNITIDQFEKFNSNTEVNGVTQTIKLESYGPNAFSDLRFDGEGFTGRSFASTDPINPDPVTIGLFSIYEENYTAETDRETKTFGNVRSGSEGYFNELYIDAGSYLK